MTRRMTFFFDAAACSGCKACQVACQDRHGLAAGTEWRRVAEVTGGGWERDGDAWRNTVFAYHLSMACNHCARPICREGCPTRAITQRDDGVVLLDQERCLGCGYCGWVCPYSAPRYRAAAGVMSKCSFCAEDLDAGLEPTCVAACPVRALDAGDPAELAARHGPFRNAAGVVPLPDTDLTEPALRLAPHALADRSGEPGTELTPRPPRGLREWSLVVFTLLSQTSAGVALWAAGWRWWALRAPGLPAPDPALLPLALGLMIAALLVSTLHLGRPSRAARAFLNLRSSWLSREILLATVFTGAVAAACWPRTAAGAGLVGSGAGWLTAPLAVVFLVGMARVYMQRTMPRWNHRRTPLAFATTAVVLGALAVNAVFWSRDETGRGLAPMVLAWAGLGLGLCHQIRRRRDYFAGYERTGV